MRKILIVGVLLAMAGYGVGCFLVWLGKIGWGMILCKADEIAQAGYSNHIPRLCYSGSCQSR